MTPRSRLARLEKQIKAAQAIVRPSPDAIRRAEIARQRLLDRTDAEEALRLTQGLPHEIFCALLRLIPNALLIEMHNITFQSHRAQELTYGYTGEELRALPVSELVRLHRENLGHKGHRIITRKAH